MRNIRSADGTLIAALGRMGVATAHEAQGRTGMRNALAEKGPKYVDGPPD
jgi:hypothetical protein